jgi:hypothetical protein
MGQGRLGGFVVGKDKEGVKDGDGIIEGPGRETNCGTVECSLGALNTKQQKDVVIFNGKITMGFVSCLLQVL